jgi:hypothetical protein
MAKQIRTNSKGELLKIYTMSLTVDEYEAAKALFKPLGVTTLVGLFRLLVSQKHGEISPK